MVGFFNTLPIVETQAQDISTYSHQYNIYYRWSDLSITKAIRIRITSNGRYRKIRIKSRGKAQLGAYRKIAGNLKLAYANRRSWKHLHVLELVLQTRLPENN